MIHLRLYRTLVFSALLGMGAIAHAAQWLQQPGSTLSFSGTQQGEPFKGAFGTFQSDVRFDPAALADAHLDVRIDIASADTANSERDQTMLGSDFFDSARFPKARFTTSAIREVAPGKYEADAQLSIRDKTVKLKFPFSWQGDAGSAELLAQVSLDRLAFGIGTGDWEDEGTVGRTVTVDVRLKLKPKP